MFLTSEGVRASRISLLPNPTRKVDVWCTLAVRAVETEIARCSEATGAQADNLHSQMVFEWHTRMIETVGREDVGLGRAGSGLGHSMAPLYFCCSGEDGVGFCLGHPLTRHTPARFFCPSIVECVGTISPGWTRIILNPESQQFILLRLKIRPSTYAQYSPIRHGGLNFSYASTEQSEAFGSPSLIPRFLTKDTTLTSSSSPGTHTAVSSATKGAEDHFTQL